MSDTGNTHSVFTKETILDALVNIIPLGIITFFLALFLLSNPADWGEFGIVRVIQLAILVIMFVALAVLTYLIAERI